MRVLLEVTRSNDGDLTIFSSCIEENVLQLGHIKFDDIRLLHVWAMLSRGLAFGGFRC